MRISDWSSDVCSSDLPRAGVYLQVRHILKYLRGARPGLGSVPVGPALVTRIAVELREQIHVGTPGHHPGHPTAVGGLPSSEPGLAAGPHDQVGFYREVSAVLPSGESGAEPAPEATPRQTNQ